MKWERDWLYRLIFRDIEGIWQRAMKEGRDVALHGPTPDYLHVFQYANLSVVAYNEPVSIAKGHSSLLCAQFVSPIIQQWRFDDSGLQIQGALGLQSQVRDLKRGMFFQVGSVSFCIDADRKLVAITYQWGPRYGQHRVFRVRGQGSKGRLEPHPDFVHWVS